MTKTHCSQIFTKASTLSRSFVVDSIRLLSLQPRTLLLAALVLWSPCTFAQNQSIQMLPPTQPGTSTACPVGTQQVLTYSGDSADTHSGINCSGVTADNAGNLTTQSIVATGSVSAVTNPASGSSTGVVAYSNSQTCGSGNATDVMKGTIRYNPSLNEFEGCNGTRWIIFGSSLYALSCSSNSSHKVYCSTGYTRLMCLDTGFGNNHWIHLLDPNGCSAAEGTNNDGSPNCLMLCQ